MEQYIDKATVVAEIERLKKNEGWCQVGEDTADVYYARGFRFACECITSFLDTLEIKGVDLEEKATQLSQKYFPDEENIWARPNIEAQKCKNACIEMVEWLKAQKGKEE